MWAEMHRIGCMRPNSPPKIAVERPSNRNGVQQGQTEDSISVLHWGLRTRTWYRYLEITSRCLVEVRAEQYRDGVHSPMCVVVNPTRSPGITLVKPRYSVAVHQSLSARIGSVESGMSDLATHNSTIEHKIRCHARSGDGMPSAELPSKAVWPRIVSPATQHRTRAEETQRMRPQSFVPQAALAGTVDCFHKLPRSVQCCAIRSIRWCVWGSACKQSKHMGLVTVWGTTP